MRSRTPLVIAALFAGVLAAPALSAQEAQQGLQYDGKALDANGAAAPQKSKKGKTAKTAAPADAQSGKTPKASGGDRQFGELEGWSPGKTPPKPADKESTDPAKPKTPISMSPEGHMGIGLPF